MTQTTDEYVFVARFYVIGVFDILGQSRKLLRPMTFPAATTEEAQRIRSNLEETVIAVDRFRQLFQQQFDARRSAFDDDAAQLPEPERAAFTAALASNIVSWGISDAYCVAIPIEAGSGAPGAMAAMADVRRALEVAAAMWLISLSFGDPVRGGIEIGTAATMRENDIYGAALVEAYRLESEVAGGPRIVVGEQLVAALREAAQDPDANYRGAARYAANCLSMLRQDVDDKTAVDVLGGSWATPARRQLLQNVFARAHDNAQRQLQEHQEKGCRKLVSRYETLLAYFAEHAASWQG